MILGSDAVGTFTTIATDDFSAGYNVGLWGNPFDGGTVGQGGATWSNDDVTVTAGELQVSATRRGDGSWTVGGFNSLTDGTTITYGRVSFDARVEEGQGILAAILMWPAADIWPPEIDILETPGRDVMHTVHWRDAAGWQQYDAIRNQSYDPTQWHRYQMTWLPDLLRIEVDGRTVAEWSDPVKIPDVAMGFGAMMYVAKAHEEWIGGAPDATTPGKVVTHLDNVTIQRWDEGTPVPTPPPASVTLGQGAKELTVRISQDAWQGNASYTIAVDGAQIGGVQTAQALHASGQSDVVRVRGDWGLGDHRVSVTFLNDAWGGTAQTDRNLYVDGAVLDGASLAGAPAALMSNGAHGFGFSVAAAAAPPAPPGGGTIGGGTDSLVLRISQDAYQGDAQFTVSVDGRQVGGVQTARALHASGQSDTLTVKGDWGAGQHRVEVTFLNDAYGGTAQTDRNLYVDGAVWNGAAVGGAAASLLSAGTHGFSFSVASIASVPAAPASIGSGADSITLNLSQDAYQGDAQFTVAVDGRQVGGVLSARALHAVGQTDTLVVRGDWGAGDHRVTVTFLNDKWDGTASTDRNLYVDGISVGATPMAGATAALMSNGSVSFGFALGSLAPPVTLGNGSDVLTLRIAQDAYQGPAQYVVAVDGVQVGGVQTATALHAAGQTDVIAVRGTWAAGNHTVTIQFLNDLWNGTPETDRNLYVDGASFAGTDILAARAAMLSAGKHSFGFRK